MSGFVRAIHVSGNSALVDITIDLDLVNDEQYLLADKLAKWLSVYERERLQHIGWEPVKPPYFMVIQVEAVEAMEPTALQLRDAILEALPKEMLDQSPDGWYIDDIVVPAELNKRSGGAPVDG